MINLEKKSFLNSEGKHEMHTSPTLLTAYNVDPTMTKISPLTGFGPPANHRIGIKNESKNINLSMTE